MDSHNGRQSNWEVNIYGKELPTKQSNQDSESCEFESYTTFTCHGSLLTLIQPSRLLIFNDRLQVPLTVELPCYINNPKAFLRENYCSYSTVLGNKTRVTKAYHGIIKDASRFKPYAINQSSSLTQHSLSVAPCAREKMIGTNIELTRHLMSTSCIRTSGIEIYILPNEEQGSSYIRREVMTGIKKLEQLAERTRIQTKEIWNNLLKEITSGRVQVRVQLLQCIHQEVLAIEETENQFMKLVTGDWVRYDNDGAIPEVPKKIVESDDKIGSITHFYNDSGPAVHPGFRITNIYSEYTLVGDRHQVELPYANCLQRNDTSFVATSMFTTQRIKHMLWYNDISDIPNLLVPTGVISKSYHKHLIKYCNDLRKSGNSNQLEVILKDSFIKYSHNCDAQLSFGLSKAFALINEDKEKAEKYLSHLLHKIKKAKNSLLFEGRIHLYKGYINILRKEYENALNDLDRATDCMQSFQAGEAKAWLCYLKGSYFMSFTEDSDSLQKSLDYFDLYLQHVKVEEDGAYFGHGGVPYVVLRRTELSFKIFKLFFNINIDVATKAFSDAQWGIDFIESYLKGKNWEKGKKGFNETSDILSNRISRYKDNPHLIAVGIQEIGKELSLLRERDGLYSWYSMFATSGLAGFSTSIHPTAKESEVAVFRRKGR